MKSLIKSTQKSKIFSTLREKIQKGDDILIEGVFGSSSSFITTLIHQFTEKPILFVCDTPSSAEKIVRDLNTFAEWEKATIQNYYFPPSEAYEAEEGLSLDVTAERFFVLEKLLRAKQYPMIVTPIKSLVGKTVSPKIFRYTSLYLKKGRAVDLREVIVHLVNIGYERCDMVEVRGEFSVRGGIIDIYPLTQESPVRIELFLDDIESIRLFDTKSQVSFQDIQEIYIVPATEFQTVTDLEKKSLLLDYYKKDPLIVFLNYKEIKEKFCASADSEGYDLINLDELKKQVNRHQKIFISDFKESIDDFLPTESIQITNKLFDNVEYNALPIAERKEVVLTKLDALLKKNIKVIIACNNEGEKQRLKEILRVRKTATKIKDKAVLRNKSLELRIGNIEEGFFYEDLNLVVVSDQEIFSRYKIRRSRRLVSKGFDFKDIGEIKEGDYVVHLSYGIGKFLGIQLMEKDHEEREFLVVEYDEGSKLYVPLEQISLVQKYIGLGERVPKLNKLGSSTWQKTRNRIENAVSDLAAELLEIEAERNLRKRNSFSKDTPWQYEFEKAFIYEETDDQVKAIAEIKQDMESEKPMDRLICGDVGFGKTEVAIRASFKVVMDGKQVAMLVPTTVLAQQHYRTFKERLADYPVNIEMLSRFRTSSEQQQIIDDLKKGNIDVVIGTHRLIQNDISFKDLGLLIIDEEQRFGVRHKSKFKSLRKLIDVLTLTATPIPRTLYMSLSGIKELSIINTPPLDRLPVETIVVEYNEELIKKVITRELEREGQVYFVHNRVESIEKVKEDLEKFLPSARIAVAHGQMKEGELFDIMNFFIAKKIDVLVCTTIIESGIDIPNVNTIIVDRADRFGLADLYQLRGRVGRYKHRAYAYFLLPKDKVILNIAKKRLKAINDYTSLGSGLKVAMKDLEIRGAGNILGKEQHGNIYAIGFELYCKLLKGSINHLKGQSVREYVSPTLQLPFSLEIPLTYITSVQQRIEIYKKIYKVETEEEIGALKKELRDRFGKVPQEVEAILERGLIKVWLMLKKINVLEIKNNYLVLFKEGKKQVIKLPEMFETQ